MWHINFRRLGGLCRSHVSREKYPVHKFITQTFTISFNWGRLHLDKGHPLWNLYSELLLLCPTAEQKLPTMWARPCSYHIKVEATVTGPSQGGSGASVRVSVRYRCWLLYKACQLQDFTFCHHCCFLQGVSVGCRSYTPANERTSRPTPKLSPF